MGTIEERTLFSESELDGRLDRLFEEAAVVWKRFDLERRQHAFHPFMPAQYGPVLDTLLLLRRPGLRFLELGSATGIITIMADLLGFEACGIELDEELVEIARDLARRHDSAATFAAASYLPAGYQYVAPCGDTRLGTIGDGPPGYTELGLELADFDVVFGFPWPGEEPVLHDLMAQHGNPNAILLVNGAPTGVKLYRGGALVV